MTIIAGPRKSGEQLPEPLEGTRVIPMTDAYGREKLCYVPPQPPREHSTIKDNSELVPAHETGQQV